MRDNMAKHYKTRGARNRAMDQISVKAFLLLGDGVLTVNEYQKIKETLVKAARRMK